MANEVDRPATLDAAREAFLTHQEDLRKLGAEGQIGVGFDPEQPDLLRRWWARCAVRANPDSLPQDVLVKGYPSGLDALEALVEKLADRLRPRTLDRG